jgi:hypothetical protein
VIPPAQVQAALQKRREQVQTERLGTRTIAGITAIGVRTTQTTPAGQIGNDSAIKRVEERWYSNEFGLTLSDTVDDPRTGHSTYEVTQLTRGEPDAALMNPPSDYKIVEQETKILNTTAASQ